MKKHELAKESCKDKYEILLENLTQSIKLLCVDLSEAVSEINHLRKAIEKAEQSISKQNQNKIEKRG